MRQLEILHSQQRNLLKTATKLMLLLLSFSDFRIPPLYFRCVLHAFFAYVPSSGYSPNQARSQVFSKGG